MRPHRVGGLAVPASHRCLPVVMNPSTSGVPSRLPLTGAVLAGGRSRRMGTDKALVRVGGQLLASRVASSLAEVCECVVIAASDASALRGIDLPLEVRVLCDEVAFQGPLGGLATVLAAAETEWVVAVGVDMPFVQPDVIRALWAELGAASEPVDVVMPVGEKGPEPLLALYRCACLDAVRETLAQGGRRVTDLASRVRVLEVPLERFREADPTFASFVNVNTAEDLAQAQATAQGGESA